MILFSLLREKKTMVELGVRYVSEHFPNGGRNGGCNGGHFTPSEAEEDQVNSPIGRVGISPWGMDREWRYTIL
jgi:hypothetical protein